MIYCVRFAEVEHFLASAGWRRLGETERSVVFRKGEPIAVVPKPNVFGDLPETLVMEAFREAGIVPPQFDVFWCD